MATLNYTERRKLEEFLAMGSGYVLDFSNRTFREFIHDSVGMDIDDSRVGGSGSKAWRLRYFWSEQAGGPHNVVFVVWGIKNRQML